MTIIRWIVYPTSFIEYIKLDKNINKISDKAMYHVLLTDNNTTICGINNLIHAANTGGNYYNMSCSYNLTPFDYVSSFYYKLNIPFCEKCKSLLNRAIIALEL